MLSGEIAMTGQNYDKELGLILEAAGNRQPVRVELPATPLPAQALTWPWQVPQVPTITSDGIVNSASNG